MATETDDRLKRAFELIESDQLAEAEGLLKPLLESDKNNADVWWLYAHAVSDVDSARSALYNVLRLDRNYPDAAELLAELERKSPNADGEDLLQDASVSEPSFLPNFEKMTTVSIMKLGPKSSAMPELPESDTILDAEEEPSLGEENEAGESLIRKPLFLVALMGLLAVLATALVLVISQPFASNQAQTTPASSTANAVEVIPTSEIPITLSEADSPSLFNVMGKFSLAPEGISIENSRLGQTVLVHVCAGNSSVELRQTLQDVMTALSQEAENYTDRAQAIGTHLYDCTSNQLLRAIGATISDATSFVTGNLDTSTFQSRWQPIG